MLLSRIEFLLMALGNSDDACSKLLLAQLGKQHGTRGIQDTGEINGRGQLRI